jgi:tetratricopeptide (TPR) repeat protein
VRPVRPARSLLLALVPLLVPALPACRCEPAAPTASTARKIDAGPAAKAAATKKRPPPPDLPEQGPLGQKILYEEAKSLLRAGKAALAVKVFERAAAADPKGELAASCYLGLGSALQEIGQKEKALEAYRRVVELRPEDPEAHRALAIGLEEAGRRTDAIAALEKALALDGDQLSAYQDLANLRLSGREIAEAKKVYLRYEERRTALIKTLGLSRDEQARAHAAAALGDARDEATTLALGLALGDKSREVRLAVIRSLGQQGLAAGAGPLRELLARTTELEEKRAIEVSLKAIEAAPQPSPTPPPAPVDPAAAAADGGKRGGTGAPPR